MRIYFLSSITAGLKIDGVYAGIIDSFERFFDVDGGANLLCEIVPDGDAMPLNFFINKDFFASPPDFADVYLSGSDALISITRYKSKDAGIALVTSAKFAGGVASLVNNGGVPCLIVQGRTTETITLSAEFCAARLSEGTIGGHGVLIVEGKGCIAVISESGKRVFYNPASSWEAGERLKICVPFPTCAGCTAHCEFAYDGKEMTLVSSKTQETREIDKSIMHFAFFESVLTRADCAKYLCDELKPRARHISSFLGEFVDVSIPPEKFYLSHPEMRSGGKGAAGLIYPLSRNLFKIKYFAVDIKDGLIENIYEVEE